MQAIADCYTHTTTSSTPVTPLSNRMVFNVNKSDFDPQPARHDCTVPYTFALKIWLNEFCQ